MKYYLINNTIKKGSEIPNVMINHPNYNDIMMTWKKSLQPCEISESEIMKIYVHLFPNLSYNKQDATPIDVTDIISDNNGVITFKQPKQVDEYGYIKCGDCNKFYLCTNCGAQCGSDGHFIEPKQVDGEIEAVEFAEWCDKQVTYIDENGNVDYKQLYEIFKNRK